MLAPERRHVLFDALRPPPGAELDIAVGTTYSLDLLTLLTTPLAFALFDQEEAEDGIPDPVPLLESVRRYAERLYVFCQAGLISLPRDYQQLLAYVEDRIFAVTPPDRRRIFHPKVWALRFRHPDRARTYRLVCATRNLTFARAWDAVVVLEGRPGSERLERNLPLARFVAALPDLVSGELGDEDQGAVRGLANELLQVEFEPPDDFEGLDFWTFGVEDPSPFPFGDADRVLVVSPFLTQGALTRLSASGRRHVLVSRPESLDAIGRDGLANYRTFVFEAPTEEIEDGESESAPLDEAVGERARVDLDGLHAKLVVLERGQDGHVFVGSANATDAALNGNVEFVVELTGSKWKVGVVAFMRSEENATNFVDLLQPYRPEQDEPLPEGVAERLDKRLDEVQREFAARHFEARVEELEGEEFAVTLSTDALPKDLLAGIEATCWPISAQARTVPVEAGEPWSRRFAPLSRQALTAFFAVELVAREGGVSRSVRFVVTAELLGAPADRRQRILADILNDRAKVLRYLLYLLAGEGVGFGALEGSGEGSTTDFGVLGEASLLESMLRALADDPVRVDHIERLVADLRAADREELLPEGLLEIWEPIRAVREDQQR